MNVHHQRSSNTREETPMSFSNFKVLTFDVVGTLIDFETGVLDAVRKISGRSAAELSDDKIFASYKRGRDAHPERSSEVMFDVYRYLAKELGLPADDAACDFFPTGGAAMAAVFGLVEALKRLRTKFRLVAMTNADRVALSCYAHALGDPFDDSVCADETGVAKPNPEFSPITKGGNRRSATSSPISCMSRRASTTTSGSRENSAIKCAGSSAARVWPDLAARPKCPN